MSRLTWIVCGFVLLIGPHTLQAQHRGGRGTGAGRAPAGGSNSDDLKDFNRAVALQASPDQMTQFRQLTKSTQAARRVAQDLVQLAANTNRPDLSQNADALSNAVEEAQTENERFLRTFSDVQKSGL